MAHQQGPGTTSPAGGKSQSTAPHQQYNQKHVGPHSANGYLIEREEEITGDPEGDTGSVDSPRSPYHEGGNVDESSWHIQQEDEAIPTETQQGEDECDEWVDDAQVVWEEGDHYQHLSSREGVRSGGEGRKMVQTTGVVHYRDRETGEEKSSNCRCLLDTGADVTFVGEAWADC